MKTLHLFSLLFLPLVGHAETLYVDQDQTGPNPDGLSWNTAYPDLQMALAAADEGDKILVAEGTYLPGTEITDSFVLKEGVSLYGGFQGTEPEGALGDVEAHPTILSGDLSGNDPSTPTGAGIYSTNNRSDNSINIITGSNLSPLTVLDGFIVEGGTAIETPTLFFFSSGGAMRMQSYAGIVKNCIFRNNSALKNGGVFTTRRTFTSSEDNSIVAAQFIDCIFEHNQSGAEAGALHHRDGEVNALRCLFRLNKSLTGGAIMTTSSGNSRFFECEFISNEATRDGGAVQIGSNADTNMHNCIFRGNTAAKNGGGINIINVGNVNNSSGLENIGRELINCVFQGNFAGGLGGGIYTTSANSTYINCSIQGNHAEDGGGGFMVDQSSPILLNTVIWNNAEDGSLSGLAANIEILESGAQPSNPRYINCLIQGWNGTSSAANGDSQSTGNFNGTVSANDPDFLSPSNPLAAPQVGGDLAIPADSFLRDKGTDSFNPLDVDVVLNPRIISQIDLGAHEFLDLEILWNEDDDLDGNIFGLEQALGTDPDVSDPGNERNVRIDNSGRLTFGTNPDARPETRWSITRTTDLSGFTDVIYGPSATPPTSPYTDSNPPSGGKAFYRLEVNYEE